MTLPEHTSNNILLCLFQLLVEHRLSEYIASKRKPVNEMTLMT